MPTSDADIISDDPIGERLEAALAWCQRRRIERGEEGRDPHPTAGESVYTTLTPLSARAAKIDNVNASVAAGGNIPVGMSQPGCPPDCRCRFCAGDLDGETLHPEVFDEGARKWIRNKNLPSDYQTWKQQRDANLARLCGNSSD